MLLGILRECWEIFAESAPYILFGFFAAGLLKALLPVEAVARHLGKKSLGAVFKASLFGIPLPLCSCGEIPAAVGLRKQGASKGASAAFLVSVPETGVDSVAITYALLDPVMTVVRPVAAFVTAMVTGSFINRLPDDAPPVSSAEENIAPGCGCPDASEGSPSSLQKEPLFKRLRGGLDYAFGELLEDIGKWLLLGIAIAGAIAYFVPADFFIRFFDNEWLSLLVMLGLGVPLYICASATTPVAAALVLKGLSPGAALVFLLAGPATNAATITIVWRFWGKGATAVYLASIGVCSLTLGWLTNRFYAWADIDITRWVADIGEHADHPVMLVSAFILTALFIRVFWPWRKRPACGCPDEEPGGT